jgi:hypothetical protein
VHAAEWADPQIDSAYEEVRSLVVRGLAGSTPGRSRTPAARRPRLGSPRGRPSSP